MGDPPLSCTMTDQFRVKSLSILHPLAQLLSFAHGPANEPTFFEPGTEDAATSALSMRKSRASAFTKKPETT